MIYKLPTEFLYPKRAPQATSMSDVNSANPDTLYPWLVNSEGAYLSGQMIDAPESQTLTVAEMERFQFFQFIGGSEPSSAIEIEEVSVTWVINRFQSPFDLIGNYKEKIKEFIDSISPDPGNSVLNRIGDRLETLCELEDETDVPPNLDSIERWFEFLAEFPGLKYPSLSITPSGNVYAQWREAADKLLSLEFLPDGGTYFVLFAQSTGRKGRVIRLSGLEFTESVLRHLDAYHIKDWIFDAPQNS